MSEREQIALLNRLAEVLDIRQSEVDAHARITTLQCENSDLRAFLHGLLDGMEYGIFCSDDVKDEARRLLGMPSNSRVID